MKTIFNIFLIVLLVAADAPAQPFATPRAAKAISPLTANLDAANFLILNIGNAGTDFVSGGGLTTATAINVTDTSTGLGTLTVPSAGAAFSSSAGSNNAFIRVGNNAGTLNLQDNNGNAPVGVFANLPGGVRMVSTGFIAFSTAVNNTNTMDTSLAKAAAGVLCPGTTGVTCNGKFQVSAGGAPITGVLSATASLDFGATVGGACDALTVAVTGAADGDTVAIGVPTALAASDAADNFTGYVSSSGTITIVRCCDKLAGNCSDPAAATVRATVMQF